MIPILKIYCKFTQEDKILRIRNFCKNFFQFQILSPEEFDEINKTRLIKFENNPNNIQIKIIAN